jgi:hypothetical protein
MNANQRSISIILILLLSSLMFSACSSGSSSIGEPVANETQVFSSLTLKISPETKLSHPIAVSKGAMIRISAQGFPPEVRFRMFLGAPGTDYRDPAATGKTDAEGKTTTIFNIPENWDDGQPITQDKLLLIAEWGDDGDSLSLEIEYIND